MVIDKIDLSIIRRLEYRGRFFLNKLGEEFRLEGREIKERVARLEGEGLIRSYKVSILLPSFLGGRWIWAAALLIADSRDDVEEKIKEKITYPTEFIYNEALPWGVGANLVVLFYTQDLRKSLEEFKRTEGVEWVELYKIKEYSFPIALQLSQEEGQLIRALEVSPKPESLTESFNPSWVEAKLDRLIWREESPEGIIFVLPEFNWEVVSNFLHIHFFLEISTDPKAILDRKGFQVVSYGNRFRDRYFQVESDVWGFDELARRIHTLKKIKGVKLSGLSFWRGNRVESSWVGDVIRKEEL